MARIFITGSTDGLGLAAARSLLDGGHQVLFHARSAARAVEVQALGERSLGCVIGDLGHAADVRALAGQVNALGRLDAVIHNAGIYTTPDRATTQDGHAKTLAVNTLAPFLLTALIERPGRLVYLSSSLHRGGEGSLQDLDWTGRPWDGGRAYAETKLQLAALAFALARRWPEVLSNAVDPGWVRTRMGGATAPVDIETGQRTQSWLAVSEEPAAKVTGAYWCDKRRETPAAEVADVEFQDRLVGMLEELTGVKLPVRPPGNGDNIATK
jgi:NAD(P)-dependent dehydrogenase (short-subunit alcohol dehydrogenase family)